MDNIEFVIPPADARCQFDEDVAISRLHFQDDILVGHSFDLCQRHLGKLWLAIEGEGRLQFGRLEEIRQAEAREEKK